jgi:hypothetical protein
MLFACATGSYAEVTSCAGELADYRGYHVVAVDVRNAIGFMTPFDADLASLKSALRTKPNQTFDLDTFNRDQTLVSEYMRAAGERTAQRLKVAVVSGTITECDAAHSTLRVVYTVFTSEVVDGLIPTLDDVVNESSRPVTATVAKVAGRTIAATPMVGYNATRGSFGGLGVDISRALRVVGEGRASSDSVSGYLNVGGTFGAMPRLWNRADLIGAVEYANVPAGRLRPREGTLSMRFVASTKELSADRIIARYGAAIEGGDQGVSGLASPPGQPALDSKYGAFKLFAGVTGRPTRSAFAASYGFERGSTFSNDSSPFQKHVVDVGFTTRLNREGMGNGTGAFAGPLRFGVHRYLDLDTRITAGIITAAAGAPIAERFLGGNEVRSFVQNPEWTIQSDAFIRSIPENAFATSGSSIGGDRFYSANLTVSSPLWGLPFLPKDLATDRTFVTQLNGSFETAVNTLADGYKKNDSRLKPLINLMLADAEILERTLGRMADTLSQIQRTAATPPPLVPSFNTVQSDIAKVTRTVKTIVDMGDPTVAPLLVNTQLPKLEADLKLFERHLQLASLSSLATDMDAFGQTIDSLGSRIKDVLVQLDSPEYVARARRELAVAHNVVDSFLHELNIYAIAPVALFDVARIWPNLGGARYALGGGVRLSLVNTNFTVAYAFNPRHHPSESTGALFLKFDVSSLLY